MAKSYTAEDISVLEGLEPVRKRPGMYIGGTGKPGLHHLIWEIVDNSVDEAMNGHATSIEVTLHKDGESITVIDNGRGIPVDKYKDGRSVLEVILTTLHAGGKFDPGNYETSGGLHGVGSSVVNALSSDFQVLIKRDGKVYEQAYQFGKPLNKVKASGKSSRTGTEIFFRPDDTIFEDISFDAEWIEKRLDYSAYLHPGLKLIFKNELTKKKSEFLQEGGIVELLARVQKESKQPPVHIDSISIQAKGAHPEMPRLEVALQWTEDTKEEILAFTNGVPNPFGGTHEAGIRDGVLKAIRGYFDLHNPAPKSLVISSEDIREGLKVVISVFLVSPQFQGQKKEKLNNPFVKGSVSTVVRSEMERYLNGHSNTADAICQRIIQSAKARAASRSAMQKISRKRVLNTRLNLPGKLADCSSSSPEESELFIVEGDSAGGNAKQGRNRRTQAILPLRGKVLNAQRESFLKVSANKELKDIVDALGCGLGENFSTKSLRYHKVILLMDADSDGHHIATLMLTFFYRYMPELIEKGHLYIAQPPLFRIDYGNDTFWVLDEKQRDAVLKDLEGKRKKKISVQRFKGLGEMMARTLKDTTLDPEKRRLLRVEIPEGDEEATESVICDLMGKDPSVRFSFIMENAENLTEVDL